MFITNDIRYVGVNDHEIDLFEGQYVVPAGMAYNSYLILDRKTALFDSVDIRFKDEWLKNISSELNGRKVDYFIIQHMEPDHSSSIVEFMKANPDTVIVGNAKTFAMLDQFFEDVPANVRQTVKAGDTLELGTHVLNFVFAPMVHWPEVMMTYDSTDKVLFSADAFGKFGANDVEDPEGWACEAARYYIGIVGKYGTQVQNVLKKAAALDIQTICALHGPVLTGDLSTYLDLYNKWSSYEPDKNGVAIAYTSVYGHTKAAALSLAEQLKAKGVKIEVFDLARDDMAEAVEAAFRFDRLVLATTTYNADIFPFMRHFVEHLTERNFQKRRVAIIENGSWAPTAKKVILGLLEGCKDLTIAENCVTIKSALNAETRETLAKLAEEFAC